MINLIIGKKGSGKTKQLIDFVNEAVTKSDGIVVCIEKGTKLTYDINHDARLIDINKFGIADSNSFYGFLAGLEAANYDITDVYVDGILKICGDDLGCLASLFDRIKGLSEAFSAKYYFTISVDETELPESIKKYL